LIRQLVGLGVLLAFGQIFLLAARSEASPWPLQVEMRVPFEPSAFLSKGRSQLAYELYLTNFSNTPITLSRIEVLDADAPLLKPMAVFAGKELDAVLRPFGVTGGNSDSARQLAPGSTVVAFMWVRTEPGALVSAKLLHRIVMGDTAAEGAVIGTHQTELKVLVSPVQGADWFASDAPSNDPDNHHRRGIFIVDGHPVISRRYAIDWMRVKGGKSYSGDVRNKRSYYAYGRTVLAVAEGTVVTARDGLPENVPGHNEDFHPAVPVTLDTVGGNTIILDLGGGQFAYYFHLQPGSLRVKTGERVNRRQILALIGDSGDAREPHLHFEVTNSPKVLAGEGLPYLIDHYRVKTDDGWESRTSELPLKDTMIDFDP
jgi:hypothetical protein